MNITHILLKIQVHNIIQIHNNVMWDSQYSMEHSPHSDYGGILCIILSLSQNIVMDLNNVFLDSRTECDKIC